MLCCCESHSVVSYSLQPHGYNLWNSPGQNGHPFPSTGDLPNPGIKTNSPTLQADSLPAEPQGKPKNTGVGSLSLLQRIFPAQESNRGLLHCRRFFTNQTIRDSLSIMPSKSNQVAANGNISFFLQLSSILLCLMSS